MPTRNVHLTSHLDRFVESGITSGRFSNASEVVREALRLLEQREAEDRARIEWLRRETTPALASLGRGEGIQFDSVDALTTFVDQELQEALAERVRE